MSIASFRKKLSDLSQARRKLLSKLTSSAELAVGTVSVVERKCGKLTCHCATGDRHPQVTFVFTDRDGIRRCKLIRRADEERVMEAYARYQEFKDALRKLRAINMEEKQILLAVRDYRSLTYS